jgi:hypothetical protein
VVRGPALRQVECRTTQQLAVIAGAGLITRGAVPLQHGAIVALSCRYQYATARCARKRARRAIPARS